MCKCIIVENTKCTEQGVANKFNSRYYCLILQYCAKLDGDKLMKYVRDIANTYQQEHNLPQLGKDNFSFHAASNGEELTGYVHNGIVPFGMKTPMPIILCKRVADLKPRFFWLGGGEVNVKCEVRTDEFCAALEPLITEISVPRTKEELNAIGSVEQD